MKIVDGRRVDSHGRVETSSFYICISRDREIDDADMVGWQVTDEKPHAGDGTREDDWDQKWQSPPLASSKRRTSNARWNGG